MSNEDTNTTDPNLGSVQAPQSPSGRDLERTNDTPVSDEDKAPAAAAPADPDDQEEDNPRASRKAGEASGPMSKEEKAAEKHPDSAKHTNPVGEATQHESKDPYAEGHTIKNPEPNNGLGEDAEKGRAKLDAEEEKESDRLDEASASLVSDQEERDAEASTPDSLLPDEKTPAEDEGSGEETPSEEPAADEGDEPASDEPSESETPASDDAEKAPEPVVPGPEVGTEKPSEN